MHSFRVLQGVLVLTVAQRADGENRFSVTESGLINQSKYPAVSQALLPYSRLLEEPVNAPELRVLLAQSQRTHHVTYGHMRIVRPENSAIFVFVITEPYFLTVLLAQRCSIVQLWTPGKNGIAEVDLLDQHIRRLVDLCRNPAGWFENGGVVPPRARDDVVAVFHCSRRGTRGLRRLRRPRHDLRTPARQFRPPVVVLDIETDLHAQLAEVAGEHRRFRARLRAAFERIAARMHRQVNLTVDTHYLAVAPE